MKDLWDINHIPFQLLYPMENAKNPNTAYTLNFNASNF